MEGVEEEGEEGGGVGGGGGGRGGGNSYFKSCIHSKGTKHILHFPQGCHKKENR